ncbi:MAG: carboxy-S-adenosyl-L-methionine synthase CmoA [Desulfosarcinaceae bacterium]|nr:carboxy-S-adenosyl-L-methionine synthase CmoA [Desulfosarcinaceae bacterium]
MSKDTLYRERRAEIAPFAFTAEVAAVFDDMLERSIPGYRELIRRQAQICRRYLRPHSCLYDLGCSHGNLGMRLLDAPPELPFRIRAVDNAPAMLARFRRRLRQHPQAARVDLICADLLDVAIRQSSVVVINFTLQFLPQAARDHLLERVYEGLLPGGILLFSEKIVHPDQAMAELQIDFYHRFKAENGYSQLEISQKREALEEVLRPDTVTAHEARLARAGFRRWDTWYKWFNFTSWLAFKEDG